jgi:hypothetical protein
MKNIPGAPRDHWAGVVFDTGAKQSGSTVSQTSSAPWAQQQPYLQQGYAQALHNYQSNQPEYYPNSTVVPFSNQTEKALTGIEGIAGNNQNTQAALGNYQSTLNGNFLDPTQNPGWQKAAGDISGRVGGAFSAAGRYGSGAMANQHREALTDLTAKTWDTERNRQMQALSMAPQMGELAYSDMNKLQGVGAARESLAGSQLQDQINRFNFDQNRPNQALAQYMALVAGGSPGQSTTATNPIYSNPLATGLGTAATLASIYSAFK